MEMKFLSGLFSVHNKSIRLLKETHFGKLTKQLRKSSKFLWTEAIKIRQNVWDATVLLAIALNTDVPIHLVDLIENPHHTFGTQKSYRIALQI